MRRSRRARSTCGSSLLKLSGRGLRLLCLRIQSGVGCVTIIGGLLMSCKRSRELSWIELRRVFRLVIIRDHDRRSDAVGDNDSTMIGQSETNAAGQ